MHNVPHIKDLVTKPVFLTEAPRVCRLAETLVVSRCILPFITPLLYSLVMFSFICSTILSVAYSGGCLYVS